MRLSPGFPRVANRVFGNIKGQSIKAEGRNGPFRPSETSLALLLLLRSLDRSLTKLPHSVGFALRLFLRPVGSFSILWTSLTHLAPPCIVGGLAFYCSSFLTADPCLAVAIEVHSKVYPVICSPLGQITASLPTLRPGQPNSRQPFFEVCRQHIFNTDRHVLHCLVDRIG